MKETISKVKRQPSEWEKMIANEATDKELISKIYKHPAFPVLHIVHVPEFAQTHVHRVSDAIQPSHPLFFPSLPAFNLSQQQGLFKWVSSSHQVAN